MQLSAPEERLPPPVEAAIYYVVSEALANVAKYAQASSVTVEVASTDDAPSSPSPTTASAAPIRGGSGLRASPTASRRSTAASTSTARRPRDTNPRRHPVRLGGNDTTERWLGSRGTTSSTSAEEAAAGRPLAGGASAAPLW